MRRSREYYNLQGLPDDPGIIAARESKVRKEIHESERDPEMEQVLAKIDFEWLKHRFGRDLIHTDIDPNSLNFIPAEMFTVDRTLDHQGLYSVTDNHILANPDVLRNHAKRWQLPAELLWLWFVVHEEGHAVSKSDCTGMFGEEGDSPNYLLRRGYSLYHANDEDVSEEYDTYDILEEGLNEKRSRVIVLEYLQAHPDFVDRANTEKLKALFADDHRHKVYDLEISLVEIMIDHLSRETGVSPQTVWQAMLRGKLEGEDLARSDFQELARQFFSEKFLEQLRTEVSDPNKPLQALPLLKELNLTSVDPMLRRRIEARIQAAQPPEEELGLAA